jgi:signal peptidase I
MAEATTKEADKADEKRGRPFVFPKRLEIPTYVAVVLGFLIIILSIKTYKIPTGAMEPTLRGAMNYGRGDKIIVITSLYGFRIPFTDRKVLAINEPDRGDVIVFTSEGIEGLTPGKDYIKRLVGFGGEKIQIVPDDPHWNPEEDALREGVGHIYVEGKRLESPESVANLAYYPAGKYGTGEISVLENHYYMLGDNSVNSKDSRYFGFVPRKNVVGKAVIIYWPPSRMGLIQ